VTITAGTLFASMIWGAISLGLLYYAKRQRSIPAFLGGIALMGISYFVESPLWMSLASIVIIAGTIHFIRRE
jgi:hypothetical protein